MPEPNRHETGMAGFPPPPSAFHWDTELFSPHLGTEDMLCLCTSQKNPQTTKARKGKNPTENQSPKTSQTISTPNKWQF